MRKCPKCKGKGEYWYELTLDELKDLSSYGGTTNHNPNHYMKCEKCKGSGKIK